MFEIPTRVEVPRVCSEYFWLAIDNAHVLHAYRAFGYELAFVPVVGCRGVRDA
jgi:hypothetical protein